MEREIRVGRPAKGTEEALGDHVIDIAGTLFLELGFEATSMALIASRARVGKQTLYRRFPDKAALFREVVRRRIDGQIADTQDDAWDDDPLAEVKQLGIAALDCVLDEEFIRLHRTVFGEAARFPELACSASDNWRSTFVTRCVNAIRAAQAKGSCQEGDADVLAQCFIWSLVGEPFFKALSGETTLSEPSDRRARLELTWRIFLSGVLPSKNKSGSQNC